MPGRRTHSLTSVGRRDEQFPPVNIKLNRLCAVSCRLTQAVLLVGRVLVTLVAEALEGAQAVDALPVPAHLPLEGAALVHVCKGSPDSVSGPSRPGPARLQGTCASLTHAVVVVRQLEAGEAEAVVGAHRVFAGAVAARLPVALVDI